MINLFKKEEFMKQIPMMADTKPKVVELQKGKTHYWFNAVEVVINHSVTEHTKHYKKASF